MVPVIEIYPLKFLISSMQIPVSVKMRRDKKKSKTVPNNTSCDNVIANFLKSYHQSHNENEHFYRKHKVLNSLLSARQKAYATLKQEVHMCQMRTIKLYEVLLNQNQSQNNTDISKATTSRFY